MQDQQETLQLRGESTGGHCALGEAQGDSTSDAELSMEEITVTMGRGAKRDRICAPIDPPRGARDPAIRYGEADAIVVEYLERARSLIDEHRLPIAISELEEGVEIISTSMAPEHRAPLWRLLLSLAALYDGNGDRARARETTRRAREQAALAGSRVGGERAKQLWARLAHGDPAVLTQPW